jgi:hypothetical protein
MNPQGLRYATLALALTAGAALAQDVGFFRPARDPALTSTRPVSPPAAPPVAAAPAQAPISPANEAAQMAAAELAATHQADAVKWADEQADRSQQEADRAREEARRAPPGVGAAWSGTTSERDR